VKNINVGKMDLGEMKDAWIQEEDKKVLSGS